MLILENFRIPLTLHRRLIKNPNGKKSNSTKSQLSSLINQTYKKKNQHTFHPHQTNSITINTRNCCELI